GKKKGPKTRTLFATTTIISSESTTVLNDHDVPPCLRRLSTSVRYRRTPVRVTLSDQRHASRREPPNATIGNILPLSLLSPGQIAGDDAAPIPFFLFFLFYCFLFF
ncbi:hypothetical protein U1Q18_011379, partial [Sarracenia purpurea var. burkii]